MKPGMSFILWRVPQIQSEGGWLPHDLHATIAPEQLPCQASQYYNSQCSQLGVIGDDLFLPVACIAPSSTMKDSYT